MRCCRDCEYFGAEYSEYTLINHWCESEGAARDQPMSYLEDIGCELFKPFIVGIKKKDINQ